MKLPSAKLLAGVPISAETEWLVDHSARVIAIYNGTKGGTRNTIEYAMQKGIEIYYAKGWEMPPANKGERR